MSGFEHPGNEGNSKESEERKIPDFIYIDTQKEYKEEAFEKFGRGFDPEYRKMALKEYPFILRLFCLLFSGLLFFVSAFAFVFFLFFLLFNVVTFFQLDRFWQQTKIIWQQIKKLFVFSMGLAVAVISPPFGFLIIMAYLFLKGSTMDEEWVSRMMKRRFDQ